MIVVLLCRWCNKGRPCRGYADIWSHRNAPSRGLLVAESFRWACWSLKPTFPTRAAGSPSTGRCGIQMGPRRWVIGWTTVHALSSDQWLPRGWAVIGARSSQTT